MRPIAAKPTRAARVRLAAVLLAVAGSGIAAGGQRSELLGASAKEVARVLGAGEAMDVQLFNEESSEVFSGGIGSTDAHRVRVGYLRGRACYVFFMKKTGGSFLPVEVAGLLHLCAARGDWESPDGGGGGYWAYHAEGGKGDAFFATLDPTGNKLFVFAPCWRPDFGRELWITPDEAPAGRTGASAGAVVGALAGGDHAGGAAASAGGREVPAKTGRDRAHPHPSSAGSRSSGSSGSKGSFDAKHAPSGSQRSRGAKQGVYLPERNEVIPRSKAADQRTDHPQRLGERERKREKRGKRKGRANRPEADPAAPAPPHILPPGK